MDYYLSLSWIPPEQLVPLARHAEAAGFAGVMIPDHVVHPENVAPAYPYSDTGERMWGNDAPWPDVWVTAAHLAAATERIRFMSGVYIAAARNPFVIAKAVGTAAVLSGNRVTLGVGSGWMAEEFALLDQDFHTRGRRTEEIVAVLRKLWTGEMVDHHGDFYDFELLNMLPAPTSPVPIFFGGHGEAVVRRAARLGDGWLCPHSSLAEEQLTTLRQLRAEAGRADEPFEFFMSCPTVDLDQHLRWKSLGIDALHARPWALYERAGGHAIPGDPASLEFRLRSIDEFAAGLIARVGAPVAR